MSSANGLIGGRDGSLGTISIPSSSYTAGGFAVVTHVQNGANSTLGIRGGAAVTGTITANTTASGTPFVLGARYSKNMNYLAGDIAELIIYKSVLPSSDITAVQKYLVKKYGL
jgi:hypothetical protein